jgi:hypothetical protein
MTLDVFKHKNLLIQILKDIYTNKFLINKLGFKGGTAAYLFYNLNRDSVDLDFDLIDTEDEFRVLNEIKEILLKYGKIVDFFNKKNTLINIVSYSKEDRNIKVEINKNNYGARYEGKNFMGFLIKVMRREDMIAFKLLAMNDRLGKANRDIFDVCFFLRNNWEINKDIVEKISKKTFKNFLIDLVEKLEKFDDVRILNGLGDFLNVKQKDNVRKNLKQDTLFELKKLLRNEK